MKIGMLWFDNSKDPFPTKVTRAVEFYEKKYNKKADTCFVNPKMLDEKDLPMVVGDVEIQIGSNVLFNHYFIGVAILD